MRISATVTAFCLQNVILGRGKNEVSYRGLRFALYAFSGMAIDFLRGNSKKYDNAPVPKHEPAFEMDDVFEAAIRFADERGPNAELPPRSEAGLWCKIGAESQPEVIEEIVEEPPIPQLSVNVPIVNNETEETKL